MAAPYITAAAAQAILDREFPTGSASGATPGPVTDDEIYAASKDLDDHYLNHLAYADNDGLRLLPTSYDGWVQGELGRAVVAQVAYRRRNPNLVIDDQYEEVAAGSLRRRGQLSPISPRAIKILNATGLLAAPGRIVYRDDDERYQPAARISQPLFPWARETWGR